MIVFRSNVIRVDFIRAAQPPTTEGSRGFLRHDTKIIKEVLYLSQAQTHAL